MSDQTDCINNTNNCDSISCYLPRKRMKLTSNINGGARPIIEKVELQPISNAWNLIDKNVKSDQTGCINNSNDNCDTIPYYLPRKRIKLTSNKNRSVRSNSEKVEGQSISNSWDFIDKNEMSDKTECIDNTTHSNGNCDTVACGLPRKRIKLTPNKNRSARPITEKIEGQTINNPWDFIDKNETMIAELSGGKLTLWQFLLELLMSNEYSSLIKWTDRNIGEFILIQAEEVAKLWGIRKDRNHRMNYDKLSRALRYYYQKNIIKKVHGHKFVYQFVSLVPESMMLGTGSPRKALTSSSQMDLSPPGHSTITSSDTETKSTDNHSPRPTLNRLPQSPIPNMLRMGPKPTKKTDFNSTLTALFQAALLSLSGSNQEIPSSSPVFTNHKNHAEPRTNTPDTHHSTDNEHVFDMSKPATSTQNHTHEPISKPTDMGSMPPTSSPMFFPNQSVSGSPLHMPPFDRQSMLHFSRHSINMQRLSQEILLNATSKARFSTSLSNTGLLSPPVDAVFNPLEQPTHNFWLNQFAQDLYKCSSSNYRLGNNDQTSNMGQQTPQDGRPSTILEEVPIKAEKSLDALPSLSDQPESSSLTLLFQKFVKDFSKKPSESGAGEHPAAQFHNYPNADLANLIKSQLSSQSSFVWMPVPRMFAAEIMDCCVRSSSSSSQSP